MAKKFQFGVCGFGNMANAILRGIIQSKLLKCSEICVYDIDQSKIQDAEKLGFKTVKSAKELISECSYVLLAVKPQAFSGLNDECSSSDCTFISIMAGVKTAVIARKMGGEVIRCMPNLPAVVGAGMTAIAESDCAKEAMHFVERIFSSVGEVLFVKEEMLDAVTAVSGSGPAYGYYFIKAMSDQGVALGLSKEESLKLTLQTLIGAVESVKASDVPLEILIDRVCSKGGTTVQAINCFEEKGLSSIIAEGMTACYNRSQELSNNFNIDGNINEKG